MEDFVTYAIIGSFVLFALLDVVAPARRFPRVRAWRLKGTLAFVFAFFFTGYLPLLWDEYLGAHRVIDATSLGTWGGAAVGLLVVELGIYAWHRAMHDTPVLWRWFHQMHHSAERVDVYGAFWFHPLDLAAFTLVSSLSLVLVVGVTGEAALVTALVTTFLAVFQHANIRTPRWLGYLVQRPESHSVHHERGVHAYNYSDLPLWDIVFGTFNNPATFEGVGGFYDGASSRVGEMLIGRDVSEPPAERPSTTGAALAA